MECNFKIMCPNCGSIGCELKPVYDVNHDMPQPSTMHQPDLSSHHKSCDGDNCIFMKILKEKT